MEDLKCKELEVMAHTVHHIFLPEEIRVEGSYEREMYFGREKTNIRRRYRMVSLGSPRLTLVGAGRGSTRMTRKGAYSAIVFVVQGPVDTVGFSDTFSNVLTDLSDL